MHRIVRPVGLLAFFCVVSGCAISRVYVAAEDAKSGQSHSYRTVAFLWNIIPASPVNAAGACKGGIQKVTTRRGVLSALVSGLTAGIIIPSQVTVTCLK